MARNESPMISVIFSFRNEEAVLPMLIERVTRALKAAEVGHELIFVNDDSSDRSLDILNEHQAKDPRIRIITTSRRFGVHPCLMAGLQHASGDAVIYLDADLQDPPELMPELISKWRAGADVVNTVRTRRLGENAFKMWLTKKAYQVINSVSEIDLPVNMGDYKLLSRRVVNQVLRINEYDPYLRGITRWVGFRQETVPYVRDARYAGTPHFSLFGSAPAKEFVKGLASFSVAPLYLALYYGLLVSAAALLFLVASLFDRYLVLDLPQGSALVALLVFLSGNVLVASGIIGIYVGRIYNQVKNRPLYIVREKSGFEQRK